MFLTLLESAAEKGDLQCQKIVQDLKESGKPIEEGKTPGVQTKHAGYYAKIAKSLQKAPTRMKGTNKDDKYNKMSKKQLVETIKHMQKQKQNAPKQVMCVCLG